MLTQDSNVAIETTLGTFTVELYWDHAPNTCKNFAELAKKGYYNGVIFHRIIPDFMIQGGDPTGTGRGGTSIYGQKFDDEIDASLRFVGAGILAMANSGPNTNGSQFFITLAPTPYIDGKHTIFGRVSHGMRVVQRLGAVQTDAQDRPIEDVKIHKAKLVERGCGMTEKCGEGIGSQCDAYFGVRGGQRRIPGAETSQSAIRGQRRLMARME